MSATQSNEDPPAIQKAFISGSFNSQMLYSFLMGTYTMVYAGAIYLFNSKESTNRIRRVILSVISVLYLATLGDFCIQWYYLNLAIVVDGETRASIDNSFNDGGPSWIPVLDSFFFNFIFVASDGLLMWRCYHLWRGSMRVMLAPLIFFLIEFGLLCTLIMAIAILPDTDTNNTTENLLTSALGFVSFGTTATLTSLIGFRIYSVSRCSNKSSRRLFSHISAIVFESASIYSLFMIVYALYYVLPCSVVSGGAAVDTAQGFLFPALSIVAAMSPTIMVVRIALTDNSTITHTVTQSSKLQYQVWQDRSPNW